MQAFAKKRRREHNREHWLKTTGDDGSRRFEMLQALEVKRERSEHGDHRENKEKSPLRGSVMCSQDLPGRIHEEPEDRGGGERPGQHAPAVVPGQNAVSADVVEGEG